MAYVSREYLREKYSSLKHDIEEVLCVLDTWACDKVDEDDIIKVLPNVRDNINSIMGELDKFEIEYRANARDKAKEAMKASENAEIMNRVNYEYYG